MEKSGSWYSYDGTRIGQGREAAKNFLSQNKEIADKIEAQIRENAGVLSGALALGGDECRGRRRGLTAIHKVCLFPVGMGNGSRRGALTRRPFAFLTFPLVGRSKREALRMGARPIRCTVPHPKCLRFAPAFRPPHKGEVKKCRPRH